MERELDGREGDDERTENERSPPPAPRSRPVKRTSQNQTRNLDIKRCRSNRGYAPGESGCKDRKESPNQDENRRRQESRSALRDRDQSGLNTSKDEKPDNSNGNIEHGNDDGNKRRKRLRNRNRKRNNRHDRRYKPYAELTWEERKQRDEQESQRAAMKRANRPTPYNTTQFLMEDHKVDTPDLSSTHQNCDPTNEINVSEDDNMMNGDYLERDFSAVYEEVQSERLESMSKEQLVSEVIELQRRVTELEEEQKNPRQSSAGESDQSSNGEKGLRTRLESLSSLEGEVERLRSENMRLKKASLNQSVSA